MPYLRSKEEVSLFLVEYANTLKSADSAGGIPGGAKEIKVEQGYNRHMEVDDEKFEKAKQNAKAFYEKIGRVKCPYLNDFVHFNAEGFEHLLFKSWNRTRSREEQYLRLRLLPVAPEILIHSHTLQDFDKTKLFVRQKTNSRWEKHLKTVRYYGFVAIRGEFRVKIIVKEIEGGAKFFWSIYPAWRTKNNGNKNRRVLHTGDMEND